MDHSPAEHNEVPYHVSGLLLYHSLITSYQFLGFLYPLRSLNRYILHHIMINIRTVNSKAELKAFIKFPWEIYKGNSNWVPPLIIDRMEFLNREKNPFFQHSDAELFTADKNGSIVGRIAAVKYSRHLETYNDGTGFFGFFECVDDKEVAHTLFQRAEGWLSDQGLKAVRGPMNFTINDECGLLVNAFDLPPVLLMTYNPPYYQELIESYGFEKAQDLFAYRITRPEDIPDRLKRAMKILEKRHGIRIRTVNIKDFDNEVERVHRIHDQAWSENWGAVPLTKDEFHKIGKELKMILDPDLVFMAEANGTPVGVTVCVPNMNVALKHANGRLLPFGLFKILWHKRKIDSLRVLIMGVLKEYRHMALDTAMYFKLMEASLAKGYQWAEMSWILESNTSMRRVLERLDCKLYKTYRIYEKAI